MLDAEIVGRKPTKTVRERVAMFHVKSTAPLRAIQTLPGFLTRLRKRAAECGYHVELQDDRHPFPAPLLDRMHGFRGSQQRLTIQLLLSPIAGCLLAPTRFGKCFGPDTLVLTPTGPRKISCLKPGDLVTSADWDKGAVKVLAVTQGKEPLIRVTPLDRLGDTWLCTYDHPLMVIYRGERKTMAAGDVMRLMDTQSDFAREVRMQHAQKMGRLNLEVSDADIAEWNKFQALPLDIYQATGYSAMRIFERLSEMNGWAEFEDDAPYRSINGPVAWLRSLQGLIRQSGGRAAIINGELRWVFKKWWECGVPFTLDPAGSGAFVGPQLEGDDPTFLLADGTVVHNTTIIVNICRAFPGLPTVITLPGVDLVHQLAEDVKSQMPERQVSILATGSKSKYPSEDITVASIDSLHKCDPGVTRLLLVDEPHAAVTDPRINDIMKFEKARRYAIGATLGMRYDKRDPLVEGLFGPVHARITFQEAVAEKSICPIVAIVPIVRIPVNVNYRDRDRAYESLLFMNERIATAVRLIVQDTIPKDWQTLIFIKHEKQAEYFATFMPEDAPFIAMAKRMESKKERERIFEDMRSGKIKRCLSSSIYAQGVTFPDLRVVMNLAGGGPYQSAVQKPGRLAQNRPGKRCGVLIDFLFEPDTDNSPSGVDARDTFERKNEANCLCRDSQKRLEVYKGIGYDMNYVRTPSEFRAIFQAKCL